MAASMRLLVRRVIRLSHRNISASAAGVSGRSGCCWGASSCRCFSDAAGDKSTHFGFETVPETEKAKRGELQQSYHQVRSVLLCAQNRITNSIQNSCSLKVRCLSVNVNTSRDRIWDVFEIVRICWTIRHAVDLWSDTLLFYKTSNKPALKCFNVTGDYFRSAMCI